MTYANSCELPIDDSLDIALVVREEIPEMQIPMPQSAPQSLLRLQSSHPVLLAIGLDIQLIDQLL